MPVNIIAIKIMEERMYFTDGQYVVLTVWRENVDMRTENYEMVKRRLQSLRCRLLCNDFV